MYVQAGGLITALLTVFQRHVIINQLIFFVDGAPYQSKTVE
jgi:hypothetical protein